MKFPLALLMLLAARSMVMANGHELTVGIAGGGGRGSSTGLSREHYSGPAASYSGDVGETLQLSASFLPRHEYGLTYGSYGAGLQWVHGPTSKAWFVTLGGELRVEHAEGKTAPAAGQPLVAVSTNLVRPWLQASFGYKGFLAPLPSVRTRVLPITKLMVSIPMYAKGAPGDQGALREGINGPQVSLQAGVRF
jgi:hypothetical protein